MMKRKWIFRSIRTRLTFWFMVVSILPLILVSVITYTQRVTAIKSREFAKLTAIRDLKVLEVNNWLDEKSGDIQTIAGDEDIRDLAAIIGKSQRNQEDLRILNRVRILLDLYRRNFDDYDEFWILNPDTGIIEFSTNRALEGENKSKESYFTEALRTRDLYIKDIYYSKTIKVLSKLIIKNMKLN